MSILETLLQSAAVHGAAINSSRRTAAQNPETRAKQRSDRGEPTGISAELRDRIIEDQARAALRSSSYPAVRQVICEVRDRVLSLRGRVPSFFEKQIAQTVVRYLLEGDMIIRNQLEVTRR